MPVAMMAIEALWTERFQRLRAVRKSPPDWMLKPSQMTARAATMPKSRKSISVDVQRPRHDDGFSAGRAVPVVVVPTSAVMMQVAAARAMRLLGAWRVRHRQVLQPPVDAGAVSIDAVSAGALSAGALPAGAEPAEPASASHTATVPASTPWHSVA